MVEFPCPKLIAAPLPYRPVPRIADGAATAVPQLARESPVSRFAFLLSVGAITPEL
jgi:hypothetical protein